MGRHVLVARSQRHSWFAPALFSRQRLVARMARHQALAQMLGIPAAVPATPGTDQAQPVAWSPFRSVFRPALLEPVDDAHDALLESVNDARDALLEPVDDIQEEASIANEPESVSVEPETYRHDGYKSLELQEQGVASEDQPSDALEIDLEVLQVHNLLPEQHIMERTEATHVSDAEMPVIQREDAQRTINEPVAAKPQQRQEHTGDRARPIEPGKAQRPRGRIEERPVVTERVAPSPLPSSSVVTHRGDHETKVPEREHVQMKQSGAEAITTDDLFAPQQTDRSPQAWIARLLGTNAASQPAVTKHANPPRVEMPLSQNTKRFLQPLTGLDTASVHVYQDATADRLTDAYQADAITVGDAIEIAAEQYDGTPETLGLLAHEFTHMARKRELRFVPPVVRSSLGRSSSPGEEALALRVEHRVKRMAQQQVDQVMPPAPEPSALSVAGSAETEDTWGGLPAPWEPLPDWLAQAPTTIESSLQTTARPFPPSLVDYRSAAGESRMSGSYTREDNRAENAEVQRAGWERDTSGEEAQTATSLPDVVKTPEPDLDALARQVYSLLKRRLGVESRRDS